MSKKISEIAVHTITNKPWSTEQCIKEYSDAGIGGITFWRYSFEGRDPKNVGRQARESGLEVVSVARGGFFTGQTQGERQNSIDDNKRAIDESHEVGSPSLVLVCGSTPGQGLRESRQQIQKGIEQCLDHAAAAGVILAIEPLHPLYAADRSAVNSMEQANQICENLNNHPSIGIAVDVYHTWWDEHLKNQIERSARNGNLTAFHVCDWLSPMQDTLNDRGLMGEGCIDVNEISEWIDSTGFGGFHEVEIFSNRWWDSDQSEYLKKIVNYFEKTNSNGN
ncbi:MAG: sugar phosphate isomerase/epimerase family protein [Verrucomicrobiota bacterium]|nr:sugar phosphate isomerase/epimerase family protein [Verrucomicrobiota bacterium]